jgi:putative endonuclease
MLRGVVRTKRQRRGAQAEDLAAIYLARLGWQVLARNVRVGRDEIDLLAVDPGLPPQLVAVEVRSATTSAFGAPEERIDRAKVAHLYRGLSAAGSALSGFPRAVWLLPRRVDLVLVDRRQGRTEFRHFRGLEPPG